MNRDSPPGPGRNRRDLVPAPTAELRNWRLAAPALAVACASAAFAFGWRGVDVPAQLYRINLFRRYGFVLWDSQWYSGQPAAGYSALFPATAATIGLFWTVAASAGVAAWSFATLVAARFGERARPACVVFAAGLLVPIAIGQFPFLCGAAAGLLALVAARSRRMIWAGVFAISCPLLSPVAGAFLVIALIAWAFTATPPDQRSLVALAVVSALPLVALGIAFPDPGTFPYWGEDFLVTSVVCLLGLVFVPRALRALRLGLVLYGLAAVILFVVPNPVGGNFGRLCALFAPALVLVLGATYRRFGITALAIPLLVWQWSPAMAAVTADRVDASSHASYYASLLDYFGTQPRSGRVEIPFTAGHWEAAFVAPKVPLARGWERQLDIADNPLFYGHRPLTATSYQQWLDASGVQWVALPDVPLDYSARAEANLLRHPPPYLQLAWQDRHWRVWRVLGSPGILRGPGTLVSLQPDDVVIDAQRPGSFDLRVRYTPMWRVVSGRACVTAGADGWTRVQTPTQGRVELATTLIGPGRRCDQR
jgi:hypothetical protein